jgi:hypothetical protein
MIRASDRFFFRPRVPISTQQRFPLKFLHQCKKKSAHFKDSAKGSDTERGRKAPVRSKPRRNSRRALENARGFSSISRLIQLFREEKIRFQIPGMSAAVLQGVANRTSLVFKVTSGIPPDHVFDHRKDSK